MQKVDNRYSSLFNVEDTLPCITRVSITVSYVTCTHMSNTASWWDSSCFAYALPDAILVPIKPKELHLVLFGYGYAYTLCQRDTLWHLYNMTGITLCWWIRQPCLLESIIFLLFCSEDLWEVFSHKSDLLLLPMIVFIAPISHLKVWC